METTRLDQAAVKAVFETAADQGDALLAIYRMAFPEWDRIEQLQGWPTVNRTTANTICRMFMDFDEKCFPIGPHGLRAVMPGGIWLNNGFSTSGGETLRDWEVKLCPYTTKTAAEAA